MLVGLAGRMQSGKTTLANLLTDRNRARGVMTTQLNFADPIRAAVGAVAGIEPQLLHLQYVKTKNFTTSGEFLLPQYTYTYREALQKIGMLFQEGFGRNFWTNMWQREYNNIIATLSKTHPNNEHMVIAADVRFQPEADLITMLGGRVIHLTADDCPASDHPSEQLNLNWPTGTLKIHNSKDGSSTWINTVEENLYEK